MKNSHLYISDLDGTLLNAEKEISNYTKESINTLIANGVHFSVATARSAASAVKILSEVHLNVPIVLMNGVAIYDTLQGKYEKIEVIPQNTVNAIIDLLKEHQITGFMYSVMKDKLTTFYENLNTKARKDFYNERVEKYYKYFEQVESFYEPINDYPIIYFSLIDDYEPLLRAYHKLKDLPEIDSVLYRDIYADRMWYLEVHSKNASKYNAARYLRENYKFERVIGFGDNINDIPLFKACDECYAVSNAVNELKEIATGVIGGNCEDGVVRYLMQRLMEG